MSDPDCTDLHPKAGSTDGTIPFTEIPRTSRLFGDFLYDYDRLSRFYDADGRSLDSLIERARQIGSGNYDRKRVGDALERINRRAGSPELTFKNINTLRREGTVAVVTGQQAGLFTGPLYTIHKALTVIKLAHCLTARGVEAVPIFWIASEDHDFAEVNHCKVVDPEGNLKQVVYDAPERKEDEPVGQVPLGSNISACIDEFIALLPRSEFMPDIERDIRESYAEGVGFAEAFARLMARIFKDYGVILLDPLDVDLKHAAAPLYSQAIEQSGPIAGALVERSNELERAGYHAQVHVSSDMAPLFIMDGGKRVAMTQVDGRFSLKGSGRSFEEEELVALSRKCPTCFSPNVTLRPIVQDFLLPTAAYIGGPAEIAYFAQLRAVYEKLGRPQPCVLPRASMTIIEGRHQKTMKKYKLEITDFFEGLHAAIEKVVEQSLDRDAAKAFGDTERMFGEQMDKLESSLKRTDATLASSVKRARKKIVYQLEHLRTRFIHASAHREEAAYRQVERAYNTLVPDKNLQERELNVYYFLSRYGPSLIQDLYAAADVGFSNHRLVQVGGVASQVVNSKPQ
ncbi:MAG: bacillithiol biosynthesis cysteine-adding enzyme BshC [Blastocatellia bacterium AA13]|nr:MAG: bacillithiol biosynthesis cysteine-adding enzyme BshC [Blastocatellia bacterium AA13]